MNLSIETKDKVLFVKLSGELDHHSAESTRKKIDKEIIENSSRNIILDLQELSFMDSSGIGLIMGRYKNISEKNGKLLVVSGNQYVDRILKMSGLLKIIDAYPTVDIALNNI